MQELGFFLLQFQNFGKKKQVLKITFLQYILFLISIHFTFLICEIQAKKNPISMLLSATDAAAMETTLHVPEMKTYS